MQNKEKTDTDIQTMDSLELQKSLLHGKLSISGMHCSACNQIIEYRLKKLAGVRKIAINITTHTADISWAPKEVSLAEIIDSISSLGYGALPVGSAGELIQREHKMNVWRLFVAGFAMMQVMMYALPAYLEPVAQIDGDLTPDIDRLLKLASLAITIPVVIFSAWPFFKAAFLETNPIPIKAAMQSCGMPVGKCRLPLCDLTPENQLKIQQISQTIPTEWLKHYGQT